MRVSPKWENAEYRAIMSSYNVPECELSESKFYKSIQHRFYDIPGIDDVIDDKSFRKFLNKARRNKLVDRDEVFFIGCSNKNRKNFIHDIEVLIHDFEPQLKKTFGDIDTMRDYFQWLGGIIMQTIVKNSPLGYQPAYMCATKFVLACIMLKNGWDKYDIIPSIRPISQHIQNVYMVINLTKLFIEWYDACQELGTVRNDITSVRLLFRRVMFPNSRNKVAPWSIHAVIDKNSFYEKVVNILKGENKNGKRKNEETK